MIPDIGKALGVVNEIIAASNQLGELPPPKKLMNAALNFIRGEIVKYNRGIEPSEEYLQAMKGVGIERDRAIAIYHYVWELGL